ncbi:transcriptional regulator, TetR family [Gottschalkia purinilytica]|uniref:Transcriptional regulator, TetR family n=1 Tax=Gottschalkia purinilytica TaxID=1503 RepID=A0A0L0W9J2_GOTPU|nr:TetR/AcrR family transcriptional regulator [Gottschalkia purinilytica]KNF07965.1 transcriptional regulator, TetR family [Gottschalkia purinilytica]
MGSKMSKSDVNKKQKEMAIFNSGYELFVNKGFNETAISEISKKAGVAKGTFYLYFKDKNDLLDKIILKKSASVIKKANEKAIKEELSDFTEEVIFFTNEIIDYLEENKLLLKIIHKNLSWGLFRKALTNKEHNKEIEEIYNYLITKLEEYGLGTEDVEKTLFIIIELIGSVCYSSIILKEPSPIEEMKPILFKMIKKLLMKQS